jgi:hypothetical protein
VQAHGAGSWGKSAYILYETNFSTRHASSSSAKADDPVTPALRKGVAVR